MAWTTPGTATAGEVLTAAFWNTQVRDNFIATPRGILMLTTLNSGFQTVSNHTVYQDEGLSGSVTYEANRRLLLTLRVNPYTSGGVQDMRFAIYRGATFVCEFVVNNAMTSTLQSLTSTFTHVFTTTTAATETFKVQVKAGTSNTAVNSYADANLARQFSVTDIGAA